MLVPMHQRQSAPHSAVSEYINTLCLRNKGTEVKGYSTNMIWIHCHEFEATSTTKIRRALGLREAERRNCILLNIIMFRKLLPITTLTGDEFLAAWWQTVMSHHALWKKGVRHCDIRPSNLMGYRLGGRFISVLNDFDLASVKPSLSSIKDAPKGFERIGTVPFMSLDLLTPEAIAGEVEHVYRHDAESFIWVLTWICLRYENGKLLRKNRPLDEWLTVDAMGCHDKKTGFMFQGIRSKRLHTPISHKVSWGVAKECLGTVYKYGGPSDPATTGDEEVFKTWLQDHMPKDILQGNLLSGQ